MVFSELGGAETFEASANSGRARFRATSAQSSWTSPPASRAIDLNTLGNTDTTIVNDLSGTDVAELDIDQAQNPVGRPGTGERTPSSSTAPRPTSSTSSAPAPPRRCSGCRRG